MTGEGPAELHPMKTDQQQHVDALRGASKLAVAATLGVTELVQELHRTIASGPVVLGQPLAGPAKALTDWVYGAIRGVTGLVGTGLDGALSTLAPLLGSSAPGPQREALLAVLNGVLGDYLAATGNPLAIPMELRVGGRALPLERAALRKALPRATGKLLVLLHGSSMNDLQWERNGHDHGAALAKALGFTAVYLRYNSGLHVSTNGREFAAQLEKLASVWPVPLKEIVLLGHSMGGLVARSACHVGARTRWRKKLRALVTLGTPHHGSPLERGGNLIDLLLGVSVYSAPFARLGQIRSAGVTDLRYGYVLDQDWEGRDRFAYVRDHRSSCPLPRGVDCYAVAGTTARTGKRRLPGDGLVPVDSALGHHRDPRRRLRFPESHRAIIHGASHLDLLDSPEVYAHLQRALSGRERVARSAG